MNWNKYEKPPVDVCPQSFCFLWSEEHQSCRETFGKCRRATFDAQNPDYCEPCEPELEKHGLPWFYFVADAEDLVDERKDEYLRESKELWGNPLSGDVSFVAEPSLAYKRKT
jgi:hypothetical protein